MTFRFYLKLAFSNINNGKKQSFLFILGIFFSISLLISLRLWSTTAEDLAARDFLENQDFEMKVTSYMPDDLPIIEQWLEADPIVSTVFKLYYNLACFNAEDKPLNYRWFPENDQENMSNPLSITALGLFPKNALNRIANQFYVRGSFDIGLNECLISEYEASELERIYGFPIEPGMKLTLSVAQNSPEMGQTLLHHLDLLHFSNVTIKGIYRSIPSISLFQKTFSANFLKDSVLFLSENLNESSFLHMKDNNIEPIFLVKLNIAKLKTDGINMILDKIEDLADRLKINFPSSIYDLLDTPVMELENAYSFTQSTIVFIVPIVVLSLILTLFVMNMIFETRKRQISTLKDRGAQIWQIISVFLLELNILTFFACALAIIASFFIASFIPTLASGSFSGEIFYEFLISLKYPYTLTLYTFVVTIIIVNIFTTIKSLSIIKSNLEERSLKKSEELTKKLLTFIVAIITIGNAIWLIINVINYQKATNEIFAFSKIHALQSMLLFLQMLILMILLGILATQILAKSLPRMKFIYNRLFTKNSFLIKNSLKGSSKNRLSVLIVVFILISSFNIFALNLNTTLMNNEQAENYYNNGSDLRIHTSYIDSSFCNNLTEIEGINEAMAVLRANGRLIYNSVTVYGVDAISYSKIGRWMNTEGFDKNITTMLHELNQTDNGAIISDYVAKRLNLVEGSIISVSGLPNASSYQVFIVKGIIRSAPGLGLSYGINLKMNQPNEEYLLINQRTMTQKYNTKDTSLFFASILPGYSIQSLSDEIFNFKYVFDINPSIINPQFVGNFLNIYIPNVKTLLLLQIFFLNSIGLIIIGSKIEFIIKQRDQDNAILNSLGNSNKNLVRTILSELVVIEFTSFLIAMFIAIPFSLLSIMINRASFSGHNILEYKFKFDFLGIPLFFALLLIITLLATLPVLRRFSKLNVAIILKQ